MKSTFHEHALDFLGIRPVINPEAVEQIENCERNCGRQLPAAVREWYSLEAIDGQLDDENLHNKADDLSELLASFRYSVTEGENLVHFYGAHRANTGCSMNFPLDGSDDPMLIENGNFDNAEYLSFAEFVRTTVWEKRQFRLPFLLSCAHKDELYPREVDLSTELLKDLKTKFHCFPPIVEKSAWKKFGEGEDWVLRFWREGQQIKIEMFRDPKTDQKRGAFQLTGVTIDKLLELYESFTFHENFLRVGDIQFEQVRDALVNHYPEIRILPEPCRTQ